MGDLVVYFDETGEIETWEGNPIFMDSSIIKGICSSCYLFDSLTRSILTLAIPDTFIESELIPWRNEINSIGATVLGVTKTPLSKDNCVYEECNLGNLITDAFVDHVKYKNLNYIFDEYL